MSFDIYGQRLRPRYCEVHPDVHCPYPCWHCEDDAANAHMLARQEREYYEQLEDEAFAQAAAGQ